ncbi:MAG TPA: hypothetical protein VLC28_04275 [Flavitalea sp.]|nr:hypothetical protein [Flavitalea sp.]
MSKRIQTYEDLIEEKNRLETLLASKKLEVAEDWKGVKQNLTPVTNVLSFLGKFTHRNPQNPLVNFGINMAGDVFLKKFILRRADWITRLLLPVFIKNYSSNVLGETKGNNLFAKVRKIFRKEHNYHYDQGQAPVVPSTGPINPAAATGTDSGSVTTGV